MYVRPHLDFCDVIYHLPEIESLFSSSTKLPYWMEQIEKVQYQAALAVSGAWQGTNMDKIYEELGWESLSDRRWLRRLILLYIINLFHLFNVTTVYHKITVLPIWLITS